MVKVGALLVTAQLSTSLLWQIIPNLIVLATDLCEEKKYIYNNNNFKKGFLIRSSRPGNIIFLLPFVKVEQAELLDHVTRYSVTTFIHNRSGRRLQKPFTLNN